MRKSYLFAAILAMGALSSCSNDTENIAPESAQNDGRQPIILGVGNPNAVTVTRGTGTVGDIGEASKWNGEELNLLMLNKGKLEYAVDPDNSQQLFANETMIAPEGENGYMRLTDGAPVRFYPAKGYFDFFAYHIDDAASPSDLDTSGEDGKWTIPFTIDGSQDLMVGKAELTEEQTAMIASDESLGENDYYCAKSSRHGIIPSMNFKHLLTRLTFTVIPGDEKASGEDGVKERAVRVAEISVKSKTTGKMVVAYTGTVAEENLIEWNNEQADVVLQERVGTDLSTLQAMQEVSLYGVDATGVRAGEALLVSPEEEYTMHIVLHQMPKDTEEDMVNTFNVPIKHEGGFLAGVSYNVSIKLFGIQRIDVNAVLTPWEEGDPIPVTPEDDDKDQNN
ncbi:MAG: fimbrillin family protein [Paraprevotella sp.]|nr:fimbrillin family protein [Paraprevotella sp.]MBP3471281.1 fimbrillin family protein [Paraprevotella sp.]